MLTVLAFLAALGLLIVVHEYGHYRVAVACGVKVLRFSVGFGPVLVRWTPRRQRPGQDTEFVVCALPLGGYVRMLDEREAPVAPQEAGRAFNRAPLRARAAIVAAGPAANLLLAVLLYAAVAWMGVLEPRAVLSAPAAGSLAERAGLAGGEEVVGAALDDDALEPVESFESLRWFLTQATLEGRDLRLQLGPGSPGGGREVLLPVSRLGPDAIDTGLARRIGLGSPMTRPVLGEVMPGGAAEAAGLRTGDLVLAVRGRPVLDGQQLRDWIRSQSAGEPAVWRVEREGRLIEVTVQPAVVVERGQAVGRIGAYVGAAPEMVEIQRGPLEGLWQGITRTWEVSLLTVRTLGKMIIGEASLKHLSGPLTIADYAGKSASLGLTQYLVFLALISVSLGVLNLLPLPVLDGGHLMYYLWEAVTGRGVSDAWMDRFQRAGTAILLLMMSIALFNDVTRLLG
jgi:regulator of sigma E protease